MQTSQGNHQKLNSHSQKRHFSPSVANSLEFEAENGFYFDSVLYNEKYSLIIACPTDQSIQFYDATTLLPAEGFKRQELEDDVVELSFCSGTETVIFRCTNGDIYSLNLSNKLLKKLKHQIKNLFVVISLNSSHYAFSQLDSSQLFVGNLEKNDSFQSFQEKDGIYDLKSLQTRSLLFSSLNNGSLVIYRTDRLPKLPVLYTIQGDGCGLRRFEKMEMQINKKDYIFTIVNDSIIEVWHLVKGKMRLVKVIRMPGELKVYSFVYLEKEKMIVTTHNTSEIRFWRLSSGRLEFTLDVGMEKCFNSLLMKDKNALGAVGCGENTIKIVQLHPL